MNKLTKVTALGAGISLLGSTAAVAASTGYGTTAPNTGIAPVSVLPYAALLAIGVVALVVLRKRFSHSR